MDLFIDHVPCIFFPPGKLWIGDNDVAWRTEQSFKRTSPLNPYTTTTTTTTTGGGALAHPHLSPPIAVTTPDHRSPSSLHVKLGISPGEYYNFVYVYQLFQKYSKIRDRFLARITRATRASCFMINRRSKRRFHLISVELYMGRERGNVDGIVNIGKKYRETDSFLRMA